jgi:hypothetical protein
MNYTHLAVPSGLTVSRRAGQEMAPPSSICFLLIPIPALYSILTSVHHWMELIYLGASSS